MVMNLFQVKTMQAVRIDQMIWSGFFDELVSGSAAPLNEYLKKTPH